MALGKKNVTIPLASSLDESKDDVLLENQVLPSVTNAQYAKHGRLSKAPGFAAKSRPFEDGASLKQVSLMKDFAGIPLVSGFVNEGSGVTDYGRYYQLCGMDENEDKMRELGSLVPIKQTSRQRAYGQDWICSPDIAVANGYEFIVWENRAASLLGTPMPMDGIWLTVVEQATGVVIVPAQWYEGVFTGVIRLKPHVVTCGANVLLFACNITGDIYCTVFDAEDPTTIPASSIVISDLDTAAATDYLFDVCAVTDEDYGLCAAVAYRNLAAGTLTIKIVDDTGAVQRTTTTATVEPTGALCVREVKTALHSTGLALAFVNVSSNDLEYMIYEDSTMAALEVPVTTIASYKDDINLKQITLSEEYLADMTDGALRVWAGSYCTTVARPYHYVRTWRLGAKAADAGVIGDEDVPWYHYQVISKAFDYKNMSHVWLHCDVAKAPRACLVCPGERDTTDQADKCYPCGEALALLDVSRSQTRECFLSRVLDVSSSEFAWIAIQDEKYDGRSIVRRSISYDVKNPSSASVNESMQIGSGYQHLFDGSGSDVGFAHPPFIHDTSADASSGELQAGLYSWIATYEWTDGNGDWHVSAISSASSLDATAKDRGDLTIWHQQFGHLPKLTNRTRICIYRTLVNGDVYYYAGNLHNDPTTESSVFQDTATDDEIASQRVLYRTSGELDNGTPPPGVNVVANLGRVWVLDEDNPRKVTYSKPVEIDIANSFTPLQYVLLPEDGVALAAQGDYVYAFTDKHIYGISGAGPDKLGNGSFSLPRLVVNDVGCSNRRSIVHSDLGVFFQSDRGIYLLSQGAVQCVSDAVEDSLGSATVISALVESTERRVRFMLSTGTQLVYDFAKQRWSVWTGYTSIDMFGELGGVAHHYDTIGNLYYEAGGFLHSTTKYSMAVESPWIHLSSLTGFQRVWWINVLGAWKSGHKMKMDIYTDYSEAAVKQSVTFTCTDSMTNYTLRCKPQYQKCKAIKVKISDLTTDQVTPYSSADLHALELTVGVKSAYNRNPGKAG